MMVLGDGHVFLIYRTQVMLTAGALFEICYNWHIITRSSKLTMKKTIGRSTRSVRAPLSLLQKVKVIGWWRLPSGSSHFLLRYSRSLPLCRGWVPRLWELVWLAHSSGVLSFSEMLSHAYSYRGRHYS